MQTTKGRSSSTIRIIIIALLCVLLFSCTTILMKKTSIQEDLIDEIKIVQLSDIHYKKRTKQLNDIIKLISQENPDIIFITGDLTSKGFCFDEMITYLGEIDSKCPKYAVLGNSDYGSGISISVIKDKLNSIGVDLLINENRTIIVRDTAINVYGLDDYLFGIPSFEKYRPIDNGMNIVLGHCPILFDEMNEKYPNSNSGIVMFSGHTHGGQITLFGLPLYLPKGSGKYVAGIYSQNKNRLYVSRGIGYSTINVRIFSYPTMEVFELKGAF